MSSTLPLQIVCAVSLIVAIGVIPFFLFCQKPSPSESVRYRLCVFLLFFSMASVISLLFNAAPTGTIAATIPFEIRVGGPYVAMMATMFIYFHWFDERILSQMDPVKDGNLRKNIQILVRDLEKHHQLLPYEEWKRRIPDVVDLTRNEENEFLRNLLESALVPHTEVNSSNVEIDTLFLYLDGSVVKLQRVRGQSSGNAKIRYSSNSSFGARGIQSVILMAHHSSNLQVSHVYACSELEGRMLPNLTSESRGYANIPNNNYELLIAASYPEFPEKEDYLLVSTPRFSSGRDAKVKICLASSHREIGRVSLWNLRRSLSNIDGEVPLCFRELEANAQPGIGDISWLDPWFSAIADYIHRHPDDAASQILGHIEAQLIRAARDNHSGEVKSLGPAVKAILGRKTFSFTGQRIEETVLLLFRWR